MARDVELRYPITEFAAESAMTFVMKSAVESAVESLTLTTLDRPHTPSRDMPDQAHRVDRSKNSVCRYSRFGQ